MSQSDRNGTEEARKFRRERDRLASESEDDWVRLVLYEDWSHGYLQMPTIMPEAKDVINDIGDWINETFAGAHSSASEHSPRRGSPKKAPRALHAAGADASGTSGTETEGDSPISFVSRRMTTPRQSFSSIRRPPVPRSGSDETVAGRSTGTGTSDGTLVEVDAALSADVAKVKEDTRAASPRPLALPRNVAELKGAMPGSATPTITETELMKRRRLLDAHIFD
jgi:hypothetical protein